MNLHCRVDGHPDLRRYKSGGFFIWFRCILFQPCPSQRSSRILALALGSGESTLRIPWHVQGKAIARDAIRGIIDVGGVWFHFYAERLL